MSFCILQLYHVPLLGPPFRPDPKRESKMPTHAHHHLSQSHILTSLNDTFQLESYAPFEVADFATYFSHLRGPLLSNRQQRSLNHYSKILDFPLESYDHNSVLVDYFSRIRKFAVLFDGLFSFGSLVGSRRVTVVLDPIEAEDSGLSGKMTATKQALSSTHGKH